MFVSKVYLVIAGLLRPTSPAIDFYVLRWFHHCFHSGLATRSRPFINRPRHRADWGDYEQVRVVKVRMRGIRTEKVIQVYGHVPPANARIHG
jgi:hypothetical protein